MVSVSEWGLFPVTTNGLSGTASAVGEGLATGGSCCAKSDPATRQQAETQGKTKHELKKRERIGNKSELLFGRRPIVLQPEPVVKRHIVTKLSLWSTKMWLTCHILRFGFSRSHPMVQDRESDLAPTDGPCRPIVWKRSRSRRSSGVLSR